MRLRNKKTGFVTNWCIDKDIFRTCDGSIKYNSLAELNEEWEDYEEPKKYWYIYGDSANSSDVGDILEDDFRQIGNYFETKEEAERAVEKLKAWKRLKDKGFRFNNWCYAVEGNRANGAIPLEIVGECKIDNSVKDLDLLFGGEE